ncbi:MAG TPA: hypothetical protein VI542_31675 [Candidatus Tectomicrobia bacterium]
MQAGWLTALPRTHRSRCPPYLHDGCPERGHDLFNGLALVSSPGQDGTGGLDEQPPGWLAVERRGAARRTRLNGVHGME